MVLVFWLATLASSTGFAKFPDALESSNTNSLVEFAVPAHDIVALYSLNPPIPAQIAVQPDVPPAGSGARMEICDES